MIHCSSFEKIERTFLKTNVPLIIYEDKMTTSKHAQKNP